MSGTGLVHRSDQACASGCRLHCPPPVSHAGIRASGLHVNPVCQDWGLRPCAASTSLRMVESGTCAVFAWFCMQRSGSGALCCLRPYPHVGIGLQDLQHICWAVHAGIGGPGTYAASTWFCMPGVGCMPPCALDLVYRVMDRGAPHGPRGDPTDQIIRSQGLNLAHGPGVEQHS